MRRIEVLRDGDSFLAGRPRNEIVVPEPRVRSIEILDALLDDTVEIGSVAVGEIEAPPVQQAEEKDLAELDVVCADRKQERIDLICRQQPFRFGQLSFRARRISKQELSWIRGDLVRRADARAGTCKMDERDRCLVVAPLEFQCGQTGTSDVGPVAPDVIAPTMVRERVPLSGGNRVPSETTSQSWTVT